MINSINNRLHSLCSTVPFSAQDKDMQEAKKVWLKGLFQEWDRPLRKVCAVTATLVQLPATALGGGSGALVGLLFAGAVFFTAVVRKKAHQKGMVEDYVKTGARWGMATLASTATLPLTFISLAISRISFLGENRPTLAETISRSNLFLHYICKKQKETSKETRNVYLIEIRFPEINNFCCMFVGLLSQNNSEDFKKVFTDQEKPFSIGSLVENLLMTSDGENGSYLNRLIEKNNHLIQDPDLKELLHRLKNSYNKASEEEDISGLKMRLNALNHYCVAKKILKKPINLPSNDLCSLQERAISISHRVRKLTHKNFICQTDDTLGDVLSLYLHYLINYKSEIEHTSCLKYKNDNLKVIRQNEKNSDLTIQKLMSTLIAIENSDEDKKTKVKEALDALSEFANSQLIN